MHQPLHIAKQTAIVKRVSQSGRFAAHKPRPLSTMIDGIQA